MRETPFAYHELAENLGAEVAGLLVKNFGGTVLFIPAKMTEDHKISKKLSLHMAKNISKIYKGESVYIPNLKSINNRTRVIAMREQGLAVYHIALEVDITEARVYQILAENRKESPQLELI